MPFGQLVSELTWEAVEFLMRYARAVPAEQLNWRPAEHARSVLEILQECVAEPQILEKLLRDRPQTVPDPQAYLEAFKEAAAQLSTVDSLEHALRAHTERFLDAVNALSPETLSQRITVPWGKSYPAKELALMHQWNLTYHLGQIAYIQLLYGDTKPH